MNIRTDKAEKKEHVLIVLDESGSMASIKKETLSGMNEQIQELRKTAGEIETKVSLITFSGTSKYVRWCEPLETFEDIKDEDYNPDGGTAMLDAVGQSISRLKNEVQDDKNTTFLVLIVSDGQENASKEFSSHQVSQIVSELKAKKNWTITYLGANQDLSVVAQSLNLTKGNTSVWVNNSAGASAAYTMTANSLRSYRSARSSNLTADMSAVNFYSAPVTGPLNAGTTDPNDPNNSQTTSN